MLRAAPRRLATVAACAAVLASGCGSGDPAPASELRQGQTLVVASAEGRATAHVRAEGGHFAQGENVFLVDFDPTSTTLVAASTFMPVHGHGSPDPVIGRDGDGYRVSSLLFTMPGLWNVTFDIVALDQPDEVELSVDVP